MIGILLLATALTGCLSTPYETPQVNTPASFQHAATQGAYNVSDRWWETFNDPKLNVLIDNVLAKNNNLAASALRVRQANLRVRSARQDQFPSLSGSVSARKPLGDNSSSYVGDDGTVQSSSDATTYSASFGVSYELDLWGRLAATTDAAKWEAQATAEDLAAARLSLIGTTAEAYWRIAWTRQQLAYAQDSLAYARKVYETIQVQYKAGAVSGVEMAEAEQSVNSQLSQISQLEQQLVEYRATLTLLLNGEPWPEDQEAASLPDTTLPEVAPGLPADLLGRRPDLRAAEMRLRGTLRGVDATRASYYPSLSLTGSTGGSSTELSNVLSNPSSALGVGLSLPFLNFWQVDTNVKVAKADYEIAVVEFRQTLLQALSDVDTTLSNRTQLIRQGDSLQRTLANAEKAEQLYAVRYKAGSVALRVWLDAQEAVRSARLAVDNNRLTQLVNQATLYQALGGGPRQTAN
ncbi:efflux transporter outer membrane subunit [Asticcacaulis sp. BYS171W]|uniref:Efflux transporter outer membrane subunit n=1 Tax=Asticcacaulis aquaticus TaxID=2984212 RepID=A0ABT5HU75_9CAUL|nr:efflux transporter outer membrane subunit [Asticcacaulis aquaticus]MDC7683599.1 efflux transporter outer membrane subunit [Asticcacaulis aquaticus]